MPPEFAAGPSDFVFPAREQILIGAMICLLSLIGLWKSRRLLANSPTCTKLAARFGDKRALWILRVFFASAALFGLLLATNIIRPIQW